MPIYNIKLMEKSMKEIRLCAFADEASASLEGQIKALNKNAIPYLEVRGINGKNVVNFTSEETKEYNRCLKDNGVSVWSIGSPLGKVDIGVDFNEYKNTVKRVCETANLFECDKIRMFSFFHAYNERNKVMDYLAQMVEIGNEFGVKMYHENEKDIYGDIAERVQDIVNTVKGLEFIYDPANYLQCGENSEKTLSAFHSLTGYFHIKDVIAETGQLVPAGYGDGNIKKLVEMIDGNKVLTLEPHLAVFEGYSSIDNSEMKNKFCYSSNEEAFDSAVNALKDILVGAGYASIGTKFVK